MTNALGKIIKEYSIANTRKQFEKLAATYPKAMIALEVGMHSPWISRLLKELGLTVVVANARKLRLIYKNERKCDLLDILDEIKIKVKELDKAIDKLISEKYPAVRRLKQIGGVGPVTALTFVLTVGRPERFEDPRDVGAYLGLVPKRDQSGDTDKQLRISKTGNNYLREILVHVHNITWDT